jgi:hypothetical protein
MPPQQRERNARQQAGEQAARAYVEAHPELMTMSPLPYDLSDEVRRAVLDLRAEGWQPTEPKAWSDEDAEAERSRQKSAQAAAIYGGSW